MARSHEQDTPRSRRSHDDQRNSRDSLDSDATDLLKGYVRRIEKLEEEKIAIAEDISEVYKEIKSQGFDTKIVRKLIIRRRRDVQKLEEEEAILDLYLCALGMRG